VELRKTRRYPLELRVTFQWINEGQDYFGIGSTRDIGAAGMFVFSEDCPPYDARVSCEVTAPRSRSAGSLQIEASGRVVRVEGSQSGTRSGFAVCGDVQLFSEDAVSGWMERSDRIDEV
jgi:PilZ domain